jgi:hypothetical protein
MPLLSKNSLHIILVIICAGVFFSCTKSNDKLPDLREKYSFTDTRPFGTYTAYRIFENIYPEKFINLNTKPFSKFYNSTHFDSASFYFSISNKFYVTEEDAQSIIDFVYDGNTAFISASVIDTVLMSKIFSRQENSEWLAFLSGKRFMKTTVHLLPDEYSERDSFSYYYRPFVNYFSEIHGDRGRITGYNDKGKPNFMVFFWGKGRLYLHCEPRALSNYFLLTGSNYLYMKQIMQMMNKQPGNVFWDDYYNKINYRADDESFSTFSAIMKHPALAMAFWIALALLILYVLFGIKRKQRIVPVINPVQNTSIAFTEAVAGLYLTEKNNKNIADKMIGYFNEFIRTHYFLQVHGGNQDFITALSKKSGVDFNHVESLYRAMQRVSAAETVNDFELLSLNEQVQHFYKKRN